MPEVGSYRWGDHRLAYEVHGEGPRTLVLVHGLLLPAGLNRSLAAAIAARGHRVILPELLGHGRSDRPIHATDHRLELLADQTLAVLDHLELEQAVVGGVSLGANVALQLATTHPERLRAAIFEMPVLERGGVTAVGLFVPLMLALRYAPAPARLVTALIGRLPRTHVAAVDAFLDAGSGDPRAMAAVLHGLLAGPLAPPASARTAIEVPALVVGHPRDLLHPLDDAAALAAELPNARFLRVSSVIEARTQPTRIVRELVGYLDEVWAPQAVDSRRQA